MARIITYECVQCGHQLVSRPTGETDLEPIYCCGLEVAEISSVMVPAAKPKKKAAAKTAGKTAKKALKPGAKKASAKKRPAAKKKAPKGRK